MSRLERIRTWFVWAVGGGGFGTGEGGRGKSFSFWDVASTERSPRSGRGVGRASPVVGPALLPMRAFLLERGGGLVIAGGPGAGGRTDWAVREHELALGQGWAGFVWFDWTLLMIG